MAEDKCLKPKRGSASSAEYKKIILKKGEVFFEKPENGEYGKIKMGDGISEYFDLPYFLEKQVINKATTTEEGLMPQEDKTKLDNLKIGNGKLSIYQYPNLLSDEFSANEPNYIDVDVDCTSLPEPNIFFDFSGNLSLERKNSEGEIVGRDREYMVALSDEIPIIKDGGARWLKDKSNNVTYYEGESFRNEKVMRFQFRHLIVDSWIKFPYKNGDVDRLDKNYLKITLCSDLTTPIDIKIQNNYYDHDESPVDIDESSFPAKYITLEPGIWQTFYINLNLFKVTRSIYTSNYALQFLFPTPAEGNVYNIYFKEIINTNEEQFFIN